MSRALLFVVLAGAPLSGAPVPRVAPAAPPTATDLVGTWRYAWGDRTEGSITLLPTGEYVSRHRAEPVPEYVGRWTFDGRRLTLWERRFDPAAATVSDHEAEFVVDLAPAGGGALSGRCGGTAVTLSDREK